MIREHCEGEIVWRRDEKIAMKAMRARLMAYTRGMPEGARLRERLSHVQSIAQLDDIAATHLAHIAEAAA